MDANRPYLSVVVCTRNDDHGGGILGRTQTFLDSLVQQLKEYQIKSELIVVEWNPPADRPSLRDALNWPDGDGWCTIRIIRVPEEIHKRLRHSSGLPLFQMIAKNVGIRASKGEFILATNVDILFSNSLMEFISQKKLEIGKFYRVDRYDVPSEVPRATLDEKLSFCAYNSLRVSSKFGTYNLLTGEIEERIYQKANEGYPDYFVGLFGFFQIGSIIMKRLLLGTDSPDSSVLEKWPYFYVKSAAKRLPYFRNLIARAEVELMIFSPAVHLHTNACGDFTLMSRKDWIRVRGYGEFEMYSLHVDSLLLFNAYFLGAREVYLSYPIYHMDHSLGWARREPLLRDLSRRCVPYLSYEDFLWLVARMSLSDQKELNGENWGLAEYSLLEFSLGLTSHEPLLIPKSSIRT